MKKCYYWQGIRVIEQQSLLDSSPSVTISKHNFELMKKEIEEAQSKGNDKKIDTIINPYRN